MHVSGIHLEQATKSIGPSPYSKEHWRLLDLEFCDPFMNMAVEEAIARKVGEGTVSNTIRFWRNLNAVVIGSFQNPEAEINLELSRKYEIAVVRRFTGGGAVFQDAGNLNFAISVHNSNSRIKEDVLETLEELSLGVIRGLKTIGVNGAKSENGNCIFVKGLKLSGIAGCTKWGTFFCHGSILVSTNVQRLAEILSPTAIFEKKGTRSVRKPVTTITEQLKRVVSVREVIMALKTGFEETYGIVLIPGQLILEEENVAKKLYHDKYSNMEWNLKRISE